MSITKFQKQHSLSCRATALFAAATLVLTAGAPVALAQSSSDELAMETGLAYELPVTFTETDGSGAASDVADLFADTAEVILSEDDSFDVSLSFEDAQTATEFELVLADSAVANADVAITIVNDGDSLTIAGLDSISKDIEIEVSSSVLGESAVSALMSIDTASVESVQAVSTQDLLVTTLASESSESTDSSDGNIISTLAVSSFEVGHTYSVPIAFLKENSSETSMADEYFGDVAYVRPQSNGTMQVSFSTNQLDYITGITYNGSAVSLSGSTFTMTIDYTESDVVLAVGLTIAPMQELGMGEVMADLHLYMSQATDLGTSDVGNPSSGSSSSTTSSGSSSDTSSSTSSSGLAKTSDQTMMMAGISVVLAAAGAVTIASLMRTRTSGVDEASAHKED